MHWRALRPDDVVDGSVTTPVRTVVDCCRDLPFAEAWAVFDSSWRTGLKPRDVQLAALRLPPGQRAADARAANPFESMLRAIALDVRRVRLEPQHVIADADFHGRVDLADETLKIVVEADSFEFHSSAKHLDRDVRRYDGLVVRGWLVLRFTWRQVMFEPDHVRARLAAAVALRRRAARSTGAGRRKVAKAG